MHDILQTSLIMTVPTPSFPLSTNATDTSLPRWGTVTPLVILFVSVEAILMVLILAANGLVLAAFARNRRLRNNVTNFYLLQLAAADFVTGLFVSMHISFQLSPSLISSVAGCLARYMSMMMTCGVAMLSLLAISYDRFLAIAGPFYYRSKLSTSRVLIQVLVIDALPLVICVLVPALWHGDVTEDTPCNMVDIYAPRYLSGVIVPFYVLVTGLQVVLYGTTLVLVRRRVHALKALQTHSLHPDWKRSSSYRGSINLTKTGALVLAAFILCWLPFFVTLSLQVYAGYDDYTVFWITLATFFLILINCILNPVILVWRVPMFRVELKRMFQRGDKNVSSDTFRGANSRGSRPGQGSSQVNGSQGQEPRDSLRGVADSFENTGQNGGGVHKDRDSSVRWDDIINPSPRIENGTSQNVDKNANSVKVKVQIEQGQKSTINGIEQTTKNKVSKEQSDGSKPSTSKSSNCDKTEPVSLVSVTIAMISNESIGKPPQSNQLATNAASLDIQGHQITELDNIPLASTSIDFSPRKSPTAENDKTEDLSPRKSKIPENDKPEDLSPRKSKTPENDKTEDLNKKEHLSKYTETPVLELPDDLFTKLYRSPIFKKKMYVLKPSLEFH